MSLAFIDALIAAQQALIAALDGGDCGAITAATAEVGRATAAVREHRFQPSEVARAKIAEAMKLGEAGRIRSGYLADRTRRRLDTLNRLQGRTPAAYGRDGRMRYGAI